MNLRGATLVLGMLLARPASCGGDVHAGIGMGGFISPLPGSSSDAGERSSLILDGGLDWNLSESWSIGVVEIGSFGGGSLPLSSYDEANETIVTSTTALLATRQWESTRFRGHLGISAGGGAFHVSDRISHLGGDLSTSGWAPGTVLQTFWTSRLTESTLYRLRLGWVWARTDLPISGNAPYRQKSDWSRLEFTLGLGLGI
jgi:hypothetical protein